ncbi:hypothetical protein BOX15_Mlig030018g2 [Macrostomum lignano]|uniref:ELMO domain-containing protein n=1 Tax=Macrostomum lignano TaxID=282301 RepID=A0A267DCR7_9PLAT|nr:hypothetical protein BOX15_Mlig030018g2 [Macrostomum lignano]
MPKMKWKTSRTRRGGVCSSRRAGAPAASLAECVAHFEAAGILGQYRAGIQTRVEQRGLAALRNFLCGPPRLRGALRDRRDFVFCLACCPFDERDEVHQRMLATVYRGLLQDPRRPCPRFGAHWEAVGFQGSDPSTDLRGCGMLGPLCLLHLVTSPRLASLRADAFRLSLDAEQNYPFCVMSINLTRAVLIALRHQSLNRLINSSGDPLATFLDVYAALLQRLHTVWRSGGKTIMDSGFVVRDLETACIRNPEALLRELQQPTAEGDVNGGFTGQGGAAKVNSDNFVDLCSD